MTVSGNLMTASALIFLVPLAAFGEDAKPAKSAQGQGLHKLFVSADTNQSGGLSLTEILAVLPNYPAKRFQGLDSDKNGELSRAELSKAGAATPQARFAALAKRADTNKDGRISQEEFVSALPKQGAKRFEQLDVNKDGVIDPSDHAKGSGGRPKEKPDAQPGAALAKLLKAADQDGDKEVSSAEFSAKYPNADPDRFARLDRNKDGVINSTDVPPAAPKTQMQTKPGGGGRYAPDPGVYSQLVEKNDSDGDGQVSFEEITAVRQGFPESAFKQLDLNKDGVISRLDGEVAQPAKAAAPKEKKKKVKKAGSASKDSSAPVDSL